MSYLNIKLEDYEEHFPESGTVRINHCRQESSKRKFYLTRTEAGDIVGFCHHCGGRGVHRPDMRERKRVRQSPMKKVDTSLLDGWATDPRWEVVPFKNLNIKQRRWWLSANLKPSEYRDVGVKLLDGSKFTIPLTSDYKRVTGLATRTFSSTAPKWMLLGSKTVAPFTQVDSPQECLVITEDYLSALRVSRIAAAMPLMGTSMQASQFSLITNWHKEGKRVLVWLDNDSDMVIKKAKEIQKKLATFSQCGIILLKQEAKHLIHDKEIREIIYGN
jgi:hypothetical protein